MKHDESQSKGSGIFSDAIYEHLNVVEPVYRAHLERSVEARGFSHVTFRYLFSVRRDLHREFLTLFLSEHMLNDLFFLFQNEPSMTDQAHFLDIKEPGLEHSNGSRHQ